MSPYCRSAAKRALDLVLAVPGLVISSPVFLIAALIIKLTDRGPVFYRQKRIGRNGTPFLIWKFRSMRTDADKLGGQLTVGRDPRITGVGTWLRKTKLDEIPQLINVVVGEMSMVGPRPEVAKYVDLYTPEQRSVLELKPGITDVASIHYRSESEILACAEDPEDEYIKVVMPHKLELNLAYASSASLWGDIGIVVSTIFRLFQK